MRNRSITIDAETEEEFINLYENHRSKLSKKNFNFDNTDNEDDEYNNLSANKISRDSSKDFENIFHNNRRKKLSNTIKEEDDDEYSELGANSNSIIEEDDSYYANENFRKKSQDYEKRIDLLCNYLKNSIYNKNNSINHNNLNFNTESIFYRNKNVLHTLSGNAIYDINMMELLENIINDDENINNNINNNCNINGGGNENNLKDFIIQNIETDCILKIMVILNNFNICNNLLENFFDKKIINDNNLKNENSNLEIHKKIIRLFNKNINLEFFYTNENFHNNLTSTIYYKISNSFFFIIDATKQNSLEFLETQLKKIEKFSFNKEIIIIGFNLLFKENCTIDNLNLKEFAIEHNIIYIPMKIDEFKINNPLLKNLFSLILIKNIDTKKFSSRKSLHEKSIKGFKNNISNIIKNNDNKYEFNKLKVNNNLGYKKQYRIKHINAFDYIDIDDNKLGFKNRKNHRKLSIDL